MIPTTCFGRKTSPTLDLRCWRSWDGKKAMDLEHNNMDEQTLSESRRRTTTKVIIKNYRKTSGAFITKKKGMRFFRAEYFCVFCMEKSTSSKAPSRSHTLFSFIFPFSNIQKMYVVSHLLPLSLQSLPTNAERTMPTH